jgi:hypothetical protein
LTPLKALTSGVITDGYGSPPSPPDSSPRHIVGVRGVYHHARRRWDAHPDPREYAGDTLRDADTDTLRDADRDTLRDADRDPRGV